MNKESKLYRFLRQCYHRMWKNNSHVYRITSWIKLRFGLWVRLHIKHSRRRALLHVSVDEIVFANFKAEDQPIPLNSSNPSDGLGRAVGGNWDLEKTRIEDLKSYKGLNQHFIHGTDIRETEYYNSGSLNKNTLLDDSLASHEDNWQEAMSRITALYNDIKENGYNLDESNPIRVRIGRSGEFLLEGAIYPLIIAKILDIESIPVLVTVRHTKWEALWQRFHIFSQSAFSEGNGRLYQRLPHVDLWDIPYIHQGDNRFEMMKPYMKIAERGNVLDIGANLGFFCHKIEEMGFNCYAVEVNKVLASQMKMLRDVEQKQFEIITSDILSDAQSQICSREYSIVLALAIFHHFIKHQRTFEQLKQLLGQLRMDSMLFQAHLPHELQMYQAYRNFEPEEFTSFIIENSCLKHCEKLGITPDGRSLYLLRR
jgi:2-polyprenyl-3-methyl-5-hydroxy-6-metoxy-1,4-benzoquinol methylase